MAKHSPLSHVPASDDPGRSRRGQITVLGSAALLVAVLLVEIVVNRTTDSVAVLIDAVHNGGDVVAGLAVVRALRAPSDRSERRASRLVATVLFASACYALYQAGARIFAPTVPGTLL